MCARVSSCAPYVCRSTEEGIRFPKTRVTCGCELSNKVTRNIIQVLCKNNEYSIVPMKPLGQEQVCGRGGGGGRKGFIWLTLPRHHSSSKKGRTGMQTGQETGGKN